MNKRLISLFFLGFVAVMSLTGFTACSDDDDDSTTPSADTIREVKIDQLAFFQDCLISTDSLGNLAFRKNGEPLTEFNADTTVVYLGVADLDTAKTMFKSWLSEDTKYIEVGNKITVSPVDTLGNAQGTITFTPATDADDKLLATITFSNGASVPYVSQINIIKEEAWPHNSISRYEIGEMMTLKTQHKTSPWGDWMDISTTFICIKRSSKGSKGVLMGITDYAGDWNKFKDYRAEKADATQVSNILQKNWDYFAKLYNTQMHPLDKTTWYNLSNGGLPVTTIKLATGDFSWEWFPKNHNLLVDYFND